MMIQESICVVGNIGYIDCFRYDCTLNYKILLLTYKALKGQAPSYITEPLEPYVPTRNLRSSSKNLLKVPSVKFVSYGHR